MTKTCRIEFRCTRAEEREIIKRADQVGVSVSQYLLDRALTKKWRQSEGAD